MESVGLNFQVSFMFFQVSKNVGASSALRGKFRSTPVTHSGGNQGYQRVKLEIGMNLYSFFLFIVQGFRSAPKL